VDEARCAKTKCAKKDGTYWCPMTSFLAWGAMKAQGAVIVQNEDKFMQNRSTKKFAKAFDEMFSKETLYLDRLPAAVAGKLSAERRYPAKGPPLKFSYWRFQLGCELSYFEIKEATWNSKKAKNAALQVRGLTDEFAGITESVLFLGGTPHNIGLTPTFWSSRASLVESQNTWEAGVQYHSAIQNFARTIRRNLVSKGTSSTFTCVHLRRGDFVSAGWLGEAKDLELVKKTIAEHKLDGELVYMATDEADPKILKDFYDLGVRTWKDAEPWLGTGPWAPYLAFEDYVGLVEQSICAEARVFIGSKCSSFTGGILNLRRKIVGDTRYFNTAGKALYDKVV